MTFIRILLGLMMLYILFLILKTLWFLVSLILFRRRLKPGQLCHIYMDGIWTAARVAAINHHSIFLETIDGTVVRNRSKIYI